MALPFSEAFTDTSGTLLHTHNAGWIEQSSGATGKISASNTCTIDETGGGASSMSRWTGDSFSGAGVDQYAQVTLATASGNFYAGPQVRGSGTTDSDCDGYVWVCGASGNYLQSVDNHAFTTLQGPIGSNAAANDVLKITISGTTIKVYINGSQVGTDQTDNSFSTGQPGIALRDFGGANTLDTFSCDWLNGAAFIAKKGLAILQAVNRASTY